MIRSATELSLFKRTYDTFGAGYRRFSMISRTRMCLNEGSSSAITDGDNEQPASTKPVGRLPKKVIVETDAAKWLEGEGKRFDMPAKRNWLHPKRPFPKNPWFVPPAPVGDAVRQEIYNAYLSDPVKWTPRKLAVKFELSVLRIEAILRLKHLEANQEADGYVLQKQFAARMEDLLDAGTTDPEFAIRESPDGAPLRSGSTAKGLPLSVYDASAPSKKSSPSPASSDSQQLTAERFKRRPDGNYIMPLSGVIEEPEAAPTIIEPQNPREANRRFKFIIADTSEQEGGCDEESAQMFVRDNDGTLRTATRAERRMHYHLYPLRPAAELEKGNATDLWRV